MFFTSRRSSVDEVASAYILLLTLAVMSCNQLALVVENSRAYSELMLFEVCFD